MQKYIHRIGNGNDGDFPRHIIEMDETDSPENFLVAAMGNLFVVGHPARQHAYDTTDVTGDDEVIYGTLYEGYKGEREMGAAYKTMRLILLKPEEEEDYSDLNIWSVKDYLDRGARIKYNKLNKARR